MAKQKRSISITLRNDLLRILLERIQGEMQSHSFKQMSEITIPDNVEPICDIPYINRNGIPLAMDIFKPKVDETTELPVIVTIHGGGLVMGDRKISRHFAVELAKKGYLVFSIEYRLAPRANVAEQFDDVCAGMDFIGQKLVDFNVDFTRIFLIAESAGAFLATYVAAMKSSKKLQDAIGYKPTRMVFKGVGLISGMFYTRKKDPLGLILADQLYGDKIYDDDFMQFMDPEHPEIIGNLPPAFLITSRGDFLNRYTLNYHEALKNAGRRSHLLYYGEESLGHAFPTMQVDCPQSQDAVDCMLEWFEQEADQQRATTDTVKEKSKQIEDLAKLTKSGEINHQKTWNYVLKIGSLKSATNNALAITDNGRRYIFRRLHYRIRQYAEVFSGMNITGEHNRRIGIIADASSYASFIMLGADMVGAPCSFFPTDKLMDIDTFTAFIKEEGITDLILEDHIVPASYVKKILAVTESLRIEHVMISHRHVDQSETVDAMLVNKAAVNRRKLKQISGLLYMSDLFIKYEAFPIAMDNSCDKPAVITHEKKPDGTYRSVSFSDEQINELITVQLQHYYEEAYITNVSLVTDDFSHITALIYMFLTPLATGGRAVFVPYVYENPNFYKAADRGQINIMITSMRRLNELLEHKVRLSAFNSVLILNEGLSEKDRETLVRLSSRYSKNTVIALADKDPDTGAIAEMHLVKQPGE